jgi:hypothetical protein
MWDVGSAKFAKRKERTMPEQDHIYDVWVAAAVLIGFQLNAFTWRLSRELDLMRSHPKGKNWLPLADYLNLLSMLVLILAVFVVPAHSGGVELAKSGLALSLLLLLGYPFAIAGHYRLLRVHQPKERPYCSLQEFLAIGATLIAAGIFMEANQMFRSCVYLNWALPVALIVLLCVVGWYQKRAPS